MHAACSTAAQPLRGYGGLHAPERSATHHSGIGRRQCRELAGASTHEVVVEEVLCAVLCTGRVGLHAGRPQDGCNEHAAVPIAALAAHPVLDPLEALHVCGVAGSHRPGVRCLASLLGTAGHCLIPLYEGGMILLPATGEPKQEAQLAKPQLLLATPVQKLQTLTWQACIYKQRLWSLGRASTLSDSPSAEMEAPCRRCRKPITELCSHRTMFRQRCDAKAAGAHLMATSGYEGLCPLPNAELTCSTHAPSSSSLCRACGSPMAGMILTCTGTCHDEGCIADAGVAVMTSCAARAFVFLRGCPHRRIYLCRLAQRPSPTWLSSVAWPGAEADAGMSASWHAKKPWKANSMCNSSA